MSHEPWEDPALEARLRDAMPSVPEELRARVLERCLRGRQEAEGRRGAGLRWAAALGVCLAAQWAVAAALDRERATLLGGRSGPGMSAAAARQSPAGAQTTAGYRPSDTLAFTFARRAARSVIE